MLADNCKHILIAGPTASGKSAFALALQARIGGTIVNADSMQVYRELRILTARPDPAQEASAPHLLYGHVGAGEPYSVGRWLNDVRAVLADLVHRREPAIFVGGTGLYFKALCEGLAPVPEIPPGVREHWRTVAASERDTLAPALAARDPVMAARLRESDTQRLVRALEVIDGTGRSLVDWQAEAGTPLLAPDSWTGLVIAPPRETVYARAEERFDAMVEAGALEEVQRLIALGLAADRPAMRALGVGPLAEVLAGTSDLASVRERVATDTRRYAKRQFTWLKRNMRSWKWLESQQMQTECLSGFAFSLSAELTRR